MDCYSGKTVSEFTLMEDVVFKKSPTPPPPYSFPVKAVKKHGVVSFLLNLQNDNCCFILIIRKIHDHCKISNNIVQQNFEKMIGDITQLLIDSLFFHSVVKWG